MSRACRQRVNNYAADWIAGRDRDRDDGDERFGPRLRGSS
jgi:hypothetical protein